MRGTISETAIFLLGMIWSKVGSAAEEASGASSGTKEIPCFKTGDTGESKTQFPVAKLFLKLM